MIYLVISVCSLYICIMKDSGLVHLLKELLEQSQAREASSLERIKELESQVGGLMVVNKSMQETMQANSATMEQLINELKLLRPKKCEKIIASSKPENTTQISSADTSSAGVSSVGNKPQTDASLPTDTGNAKKRGNNGSKRKEYFCTRIQEHDIWPDEEGFDKDLAEVIRTIDLIRYEYIPPSFIKHIYHLKICRVPDKLIQGKTPAAPFLNSNFDSSFIAGMLQLRYGYSLPIERIIRLFKECGFDINKATAHGLLTKAYGLLQPFEDVMKNAVLEDDYINMDESFFTALEVGPRAVDHTKSSKVYIWCAQARHKNLIHFFYDRGSRATKMLTDYVPKTYKGAIQSDGLSNYEILQGDDYPQVTHLTCWQHCKRDFLDLKENPDAAAIVRQINKLYAEERKIDPGWTAEKKIERRKKYAPPVFARIKALINATLEKKSTLPKSNLAKACNKTLNQFETLCAYIKGADYDPDNNAIERTMRNISLSRRNSLFFGSHQGAKRSALFLSLACSCRLHEIDIFKYFKDILEKTAENNGRKDCQKLRNLLPDKYNQENE